MCPLELEDLKIPISSLKEGVTEFSFQASPDEIEAGPEWCFNETIYITVRATRMMEDFLLDLKASSMGSFVCDRCGEDFTRKVEGQVRTLLTFDRTKAGDEEDDDVRLLAPTTVEIDLRGDVIDALVLAIPAKHVCRESCRGLCSQCGTNLNESQCNCQSQAVDPRWENLKKLKFDK